MFNNIFGPSINLLILDMFLDNPDEYMNVREVARKVNKNPGSVSRILPQLVEKELIEQVRVGKNIYAYHLNTNSEIVNLLLEFYLKLGGLMGGK